MNRTQDGAPYGTQCGTHCGAWHVALRTLACCAAAVSALALPAAALAQADAFPSRPVTVIASIAAGGPIDLEARLYTPRISALLGQSFVLDFKPGAAGTIGSAYVAKSRPDGYTLLVTSAGFTVFPAFYKDLSFDVVKDFAPISAMSERASVLMVPTSFPVKSFAEYMAYAKANPGKINYGTTGVGSITHLAGAWMHGATGTKVTFIPYKGTGPLLIELVAGRVNVASGTTIAALPLIKQGKVRPIAMLNARRSRQLPDVPTVAEQGIPGYNYQNWVGFLAPGGTPAAVVNKLGEGFARVAKMPEVIAALEAEGSSAVGNTPAQFAKQIATETATWQKIVDDNGIRLEE
jgi:tripartite-type tricarboxylate transporter receptor subunit TctC